MKHFLVIWHGSKLATVLSARTDLDLADQLDLEGDYMQADIYKLPCKYYVTTDLENGQLLIRVTDSVGDLLTIPKAIKEKVLKKYTVQL